MAVFFPDQDKEMTCPECGNKTFQIANVYMLKKISPERYERELMEYAVTCNQCGHEENISKSTMFIDS